jgi:MFS family permease
MIDMTTVLPQSHSLSTGREQVRASRQSSTSAHGIAFWLAAAAFMVNMGMSAVPTPLYPLYQQRDGFSNLMITIIYAVYAIGVVASLFMAGHLSDSYGRRRVFVPALLINAVSGVVFIFEPSLAGLLIARVISGISVGLTTATATSYLAELHAKHRPDASTRRADVVATASNLGGIGFGPLIAGFLVQLLPIPLRLSYIVFAAVLVALAAALTLAPETVARPMPRPRYRPQRVAVPPAARATFFAATAAGLAAFAVFGVFNSLVPSFLAGTLHNSSHIVAGAAAFAPFAAAAVAQIVQAQTDSLTLLRRAVPVVVLGLAMFAAGMWAGSLPLFLAGGVVTGAGAGMVFKGALVVTVSKAPAGARAEVLAGYFLGAYIGLSVPVIGLGLATNYWAAREVMLVFVVLAAIAITAAVSAVVRLNSQQVAHQPRPDR